MAIRGRDRSVRRVQSMHTPERPPCGRDRLTMYQLLGDFRQNSVHEVPAYVSWRFDTVGMTSLYGLVGAMVDLALADLPSQASKRSPFLSAVHTL